MCRMFAIHVDSPRRPPRGDTGGEPGPTLLALPLALALTLPLFVPLSFALPLVLSTLYLISPSVLSDLLCACPLLAPALRPVPAGGHQEARGHLSVDQGEEQHTAPATVHEHAGC